VRLPLRFNGDFPSTLLKLGLNQFSYSRGI
jgi:hypothetical protein